MTYRQAILKRKAEAVFAYPFVLLGKLLSLFFPLKTKHEIFIFCPSADIGGANKVNADLCKCFANKSPLVIFSKKPKNNEFLTLFQIEGVRIIDLHYFIDNKLYHFVNFFYRGIISSWINKGGKPVVIGGESLFFYKVLPYIKKEAKLIEISHLNTWFNYTQSFVKDIDIRIFSTVKLKRDAEAIYKKNNLPREFYSRLIFIDNMVKIPERFENKNQDLEVVFIGRGSPQKRVHLIAAIAKELHDQKSNIHFSFVGDVEKIINPKDFPYCTFYGNVRDRNKMEDIYKASDVLLLTSAFEGLPIAIMEMMAYGKVVLSSAVDGIPDYITNGQNGFLLGNNRDEDKIIEEGISVLNKLAGNKDLLEETGRNSRRYAEKHFSGKVFCEKYGKVLFG
ncbi:MAG: glycosyltransferase family 4 protein [Bacteroidota bacterium]|nr:glycosyltransferase family 4 protein [Bacteroidota bacterium]